MFFTSALAGSEWSALHLGRLNSFIKPRYQLSRRLGGPQGWSAHLGEKSVTSAGNRNLVCTARCPVAVFYVTQYVRKCPLFQSLVAVSFIHMVASQAIKPFGRRFVSGEIYSADVTRLMVTGEGESHGKE